MPNNCASTATMLTLVTTHQVLLHASLKLETPASFSASGPLVPLLRGFSRITIGLSVCFFNVSIVLLVHSLTVFPVYHCVIVSLLGQINMLSPRGFSFIFTFHLRNLSSSQCKSVGTVCKQFLLTRQ